MALYYFMFLICDDCTPSSGGMFHSSSLATLEASIAIVYMNIQWFLQVYVYV